MIERASSSSSGGVSRSLSGYLGASRSTPERAVALIAASRAVTFSGGNAAFIGLLFILYRETDSALVVAVGSLATFAVPVLASPFAGWLGDRFDRRRVIIASELAGAFCFLLSAFVTTSPAALLVLRVGASLAAAPFMSATAAALPGIVRSGDLDEANAKLARAGISGGVIGPVAGAGLIAAWGPPSVFLFNVATSLVSVALLISIKADFRPGQREAEDGFLSEMSAGFNYLRRNPILRPVTLAYGAIFVGVGLTAPAEVVVNSVFHQGALGLAGLTFLWALGGIAGTKVAERKRLSGRRASEVIAALAAASVGLTLGFFVVGFAPAFFAVLIGMAIAGAADGAWLVVHEGLVQRVTPDAIRSRVFAGSEAVYMSGLCIGTVSAGGSISLLGAGRTFQLGALGALLGCVLLAIAASKTERFPPQAGDGRRGIRPRLPFARPSSRGRRGAIASVAAPQETV